MKRPSIEVKRIESSGKDDSSHSAIADSINSSKLNRVIGNASADREVPPEQPIVKNRKQPVTESGGSAPEQPVRQEEPEPQLQTKSMSADVELDENIVRAIAERVAQKKDAEYSTEINALAEKQQELLNKLDEQAQQYESRIKAQEEKFGKQKRNLELISSASRMLGFDDYIPSLESSRSETTYISSIENRGGFDGRSLVREFMRIHEDKAATPVVAVHSMSGAIEYQVDTRNLDYFTAANKEKLIRGWDNYAKEKLGLLKGSRTIVDSAAPTTLSNIAPAFLDQLSSIMRVTHGNRFVSWQFCNNQVSLGISPGQTAIVPRVLLLDEGDDPSDWHLTPGVHLTEERQPLNATSEPIVILENGIGKPGGKVKPPSIPEFYTAYSLIDLIQVLDQRLRYNYESFEDKSISSLWFQSSINGYNNGGNIVLAPGDVAANGGGQLTKNFLASAVAFAADTLKMPPYDAQYALICNATHLTQLDRSFDGNQRWLDPSQREALTNYLRTVTNQPIGAVSGYQGTYGNVHIFAQNAYSVGTPGSPGVQTQTLGGQSVTTQTAFLIGLGTVGRAVAMPYMIREIVVRDGRSRDFYWISHEGFGALDIDPALSPGQQPRVIKLNLSTVEV